MKQKKILIFSLIFFILIILYIIFEYKKIFKIHYILIDQEPVSNAIRNQILDSTKENIFLVNLNQVKKNLKKVLKKKNNFEIIKEYPDTLNILIQQDPTSIIIEIIDFQTKSKIQKLELKNFNNLLYIPLNRETDNHLIIQFYLDRKKEQNDSWKKTFISINKILKTTYKWNYIFFQQIEKISFSPLYKENFIQLKNYPILFHFEKYLSFQTLIHIFIAYSFLNLKSINFKRIYIDKNHNMVGK